MRLTLALYVCLCLWLSSCSDDQTAVGALDGGRSLEWTVEKYQYYVDQNQFDEAKTMSTPAEQLRLDKLAAVMVSEPVTETIITTDFLQIDCKAEGKITYCHCLVEDAYERYELVYKLVWAQGKWLIDAPDGDRFGEDVMDDVLNGMDEIMQ